MVYVHNRVCRRMTYIVECIVACIVACIVEFSVL